MTPQDRPPFAVLNGQMVPYDEAKISIMAPGLTFAVLAFEGLRGYWNAEEGQLYVFRVAEHMQRLAFSNAVIEIDEPEGALVEEMLALIRKCDFREDVYVRVQTYIDDWGDMTASGPVGWSIICRQRGRVAAFVRAVISGSAVGGVMPTTRARPGLRRPPIIPTAVWPGLRRSALATTLR